MLDQEGMLWELIQLFMLSLCSLKLINRQGFANMLKPGTQMCALMSANKPPRSNILFTQLKCTENMEITHPDTHYTQSCEVTWWRCSTVCHWRLINCPVFTHQCHFGPILTPHPFYLSGVSSSVGPKHCRALHPTTCTFPCLSSSLVIFVGNNRKCKLCGLCCCILKVEVICTFQVHIYILGL